MNKNEYHSLPLKDEEGKLNMQSTQTRYLERYEVSTNSYTQNVRLVYDIKKDGKRLLTGFNQVGDSKPFLQFSYKEISSTFVIDKISLPYSVYTAFDWQQIEDSDWSEKAHTVKLGHKNSDYRIDYGPDYALISYLNDGKLHLKVFNKDLTEERKFEDDHFLSSPIGKDSKVKEYEAVLASDKIVSFILYYDNDKRDLYLFNINKDGSCLSPHYSPLSDTTIIRFGEDFIARVDTDIGIIEWNENTKSWIQAVIHTETNNQNILLATSKGMVVTYDDEYLYLAYKDVDHKWQTKPSQKLDIKVVNNIQSTIDKFPLEKDNNDQKKNLFNLFRNNALQLSGNLILLTSWVSEGSRCSMAVEEILELENPQERR